MKKLSLILATVMAAALLLTGCFGTTDPAPTALPTATPTATATVAPTATDAPMTSPDVTNMLEATGTPGSLDVAPSPSASTAP